MDISSLNSSYLTQAATSAAENSSEASKASRKDYTNSSDEEMMDACKQFEAYFIEQVLKEVKKTLPEDENQDQPTSTLVDYFKDSFIQDIAGDIQEQSGIGLAQQMYEQMKRNYSNLVPAASLEEQNEGSESSAEESVMTEAAEEI